MYIQREEGRKIMILIHGREEKRKEKVVVFPKKIASCSPCSPFAKKC